VPGQGLQSRVGCGQLYDLCMLRGATYVAFIPVTDVPAATSFYADTLGLQVTDENPYAVVLDAAGTMLRLTKVETLSPQPFTIAGWKVADMATSVASLRGRGVDFLRFDGMEQDETGVWVAPGGDCVAWFKDPDGNTLSITSFAT
jgi:catechol 2,3-dioxygenase-like lactoylglutathione lyase family enzyme